MHMLTIANVVVRPPRSTYSDFRLANCVVLSDGTTTKRVPVNITNSRSQKIIGSFYPSPCAAPGNPAVMYLHGNASDQCEGAWLAPILCPQGVGLLCIDMTGSGRSDGPVIGLGLTEREDVRASLEFLRKEMKVGPVVLWGRSMGATVALWCAADKCDIQGVISDSGYESLQKIIEDLVGDSWWKWALVKLIYPLVDRHVRKLGGYQMSDVLIKGLEKASCPVLFVHSADDDFVGVRQSREMFAKYGAKKKYLASLHGEHNSVRPKDVKAIELAFLLNVFDIEADTETMEDDDVDDRSSQHFGNVRDIIGQ